MTNHHQTPSSNLDSQELLYMLISKQIIELGGRDFLSGASVTGVWNHISTLLVILVVVV